jgi:putative membrane protein
MTNRWILAGCVALLAACGGGESASTNTTGTPETETTGTAQSVQQTSTAIATATGITGGTVSNTSPADKEFVSNAGMAGLAEVQMGKLALQKAQNADVKAFAQRMVTDHTQSNTELSNLATAKGLVLPAELAGKHQQGLEHLQSLSGAEFDKAYMQHMVSDHQEAVTLFQNGTTAGDPDIQAFANKTLPILQQHLQLATTVAGKI